MQEKKCISCCKSLLVGSFRAHPRDGHIARCIPCDREYNKRYRLANLDRIKRNNRAISRTEKRKAESRERNRGRKRVYVYDRDKLRSHNAVTRAIANGSLVRRPCVRCGNPEVEAHHPDYTKPLDVVWLCMPHHHEVHRKYQD